MNLFVPCAGRSSRYKTATPKYLLAMPDARLMVEHAVDGFAASADRLVFAILAEHDTEHNAGAILRELFPNAEVAVFDAVTRGQAETVAQMVRRTSATGPLLVKDSDSAFTARTPYPEDNNAVSVCSAREIRGVRLDNKGFAKLNEHGHVVATLEKEIASEWFSCGGYFFREAGVFADAFDAFDRASDGREMYLTHVIDSMIAAGESFVPVACERYHDWGTDEEWVAYRNRFGTVLLDIDGVIYENGSRFGRVRWGENAPIPQAVDRVRALKDEGQYVLLVTSRPESYRDATEAQLSRDGVPYDQLVMGVLHGTRTLVNDFAPSTPFPSAVAVNTPRNSGDWVDAVRTAH